MTQHVLELPDSISRSAEQFAARDHVSLQQFVAIALAEKISALDAAQFFSERASLADLSEFDRILAQVPAGDVIAGDEVSDERAAEPPTTSP